MFIPIGDDNRDRKTTPVINYILVALNIFVFVYYQAFGRDIYFTYAFATVPAEILTATDIITSSKMLVDPYTKQLIELPGLRRTESCIQHLYPGTQPPHTKPWSIRRNIRCPWWLSPDVSETRSSYLDLYYYSDRASVLSCRHLVYIPGDQRLWRFGRSGSRGSSLCGPHRRIYFWPALDQKVQKASSCRA